MRSKAVNGRPPLSEGPRCRLSPRRTRRARLALHLSGLAVATRLGVPLSTYYSWEAGTRLPPMSAVKALTRILAQPTEVLLCKRIRG